MLLGLANKSLRSWLHCCYFVLNISISFTKRKLLHARQKFIKFYSNVMTQPRYITFCDPLHQADIYIKLKLVFFVDTNTCQNTAFHESNLNFLLFFKIMALDFIVNKGASTYPLFCKCHMDLNELQTNKKLTLTMITFFYCHCFPSL